MMYLDGVVPKPLHVVVWYPKRSHAVWWCGHTSRIGGPEHGPGAVERIVDPWLVRLALAYVVVDQGWKGNPPYP